MKPSEFMKMEGLETLDITINDETGETKESFFSWNPCGCCQVNQGGNRYDCYGYHRESNSIVNGYEICDDCLMKIEYGDNLENQ